MAVVTANDLKTKGIASIEQLLQDAQEVIISVRGKPRYVVMDIAHFDYLRERELEAAWAESRADVAAGRYRREGAEDHIARLKAELNDAL